MRKCVTHGCSVTVSYIGTLDNGRIFQSTEQDGPLTFTVGAGELFPALEQAIIGMADGETRNITLTADEAYGPHRQENIIRVGREQFPSGREIIPGQKLSIEFNGSVSRVMIVTGLDDQMVTLDGNHPLAGQVLTFSLRVDRVESPKILDISN